MNNILVLHGPNLNLLASRETGLYGHESLEDLNKRLRNAAKAKAYSLTCFQSNSESALIDAIHQAKLDNCSYIIFNPAAFTHSSIALRDALLAVNIPFIEIHISNIYAREAFRQYSYFSDIAKGTITGFGTESYLMALEAIFTIFSRES